MMTRAMYQAVEEEYKAMARQLAGEVAICSGGSLHAAETLAELGEELGYTALQIAVVVHESIVLGYQMRRDLEEGKAFVAEDGSIGYYDEADAKDDE